MLHEKSSSGGEPQRYTSNGVARVARSVIDAGSGDWCGRGERRSAAGQRPLEDVRGSQGNRNIDHRGRKQDGGELRSSRDSRRRMLRGDADCAAGGRGWIAAFVTVAAESRRKQNQRCNGKRRDTPVPQFPQPFGHSGPHTPGMWPQSRQAAEVSRRLVRSDL